MALVVFMRGVNVGGHRTFRPAALAKELAAFGVVNVGTAGTFVIRKSIAHATQGVELRRALKPIGSIYRHCDPTASRRSEITPQQNVAWDLRRSLSNFRPYP